MQQHPRYLLATLVVGVGLVSVPQSPALASGPESDEPETHCIVEVTPMNQARPTEAECFDTKQEAIDHLGVTIASADARGVLDSTILGTAYEDPDGGGSSITFWGTSGCFGVVFGFSTLSASWVNTISSAGGANGCWVTLYSAAQYGGSRLNCTPWCANAYGLDDNVESLVFRPTGTFG